MIVRRASVVVAVLALAACHRQTKETPPPAEKASSPATLAQTYAAVPAFNGANLGHAVASAGAYVVVGEAQGDVGGIAAGTVRVFDAATGALTLTIPNPVPAAGDFFGSALLVDGQTLYVGAPGAAVTGILGAGLVYRFTLPSGNLVATIPNPAPGPDDHFGVSLAGDNGTLLIGAWNDTGVVAGEGAVHVFTASGATYSAMITNPSPGTGDAFGNSLAGTGASFVVGAPGDAVGASSGAGSVHCFTGTTFVRTISNPAPAASDDFGRSVAVRGDEVLIGAPGDDQFGAEAGRAYLFDRSTGALVRAYDKPSPAAGDRFGSRVAFLKTQEIAISAPGESVGGVSAGAVYRIDPVGGNALDTIVNPTPGNFDEFGFAIESRGGDLLVGAAFDDRDGASDTGSAYRYLASPVSAGPTIVGSLSLPGPTVTQLRLGLGKVFLGGTYNQFPDTVVDVSRPSAPSVMGTIPSGSGMALNGAGARFYVGVNSGGPVLQTYDANTLTLQSSLFFGGTCNAGQQEYSTFGGGTVFMTTRCAAPPSALYAFNATGTSLIGSALLGGTPGYPLVNAATGRVYVCLNGGSTQAFESNLTSLGNLGGCPLAANPVTNRVYFQDASGILVRDGTTHATLATFPVVPPGCAGATTVDTAGNRLLVADTCAGAVRYLDGTTGAQLGGVFTGGGVLNGNAQAMAYDPATRLLYFTVSFGGAQQLFILVDNLRPVPGDDPLTIVEDTATTIPIPTLLANDSEGDAGQTLSLSLPSSKSVVGGDVSISAGNVLYTPPANFSGEDLIVYRVDDGSGAPNATADGTIRVTITPDATTLQVVAVGTPPSEGGIATFEVRLSEPESVEVTATWATADGSADAGDDYVFDTGTVVFAPGEVVKTVTVQTVEDATDEPDEDFHVFLTSASIPVTGYGTAAIVDDDLPPIVSIADASVGEGDTGAPLASFLVSLQRASAFTVTVSYATTDGTAMDGIDYAGTIGTVTFAPGETLKTIGIQVYGDSLTESDEDFTVTLSSPVNGDLPVGTGTATGTIFDDDAAPALSIGDAGIIEGDLATFTISLSHPSSSDVTFDAGTVNGTATTPEYSGVFLPGVTIPAGETSTSISITTFDDTIDEPEETFFLVIQNSTTPIADSVGEAVLIDDDLPVEIGILPIPQIVEGDAGTAMLVVQVGLSQPSGWPVSVDFSTAGGTAAAGLDFEAVSGTLVFLPGTTTHEVQVPIAGDLIDESDETFDLQLSNPANGTIASAPGTCTIQDDDAAPVISIANASADEPDSGSTNAVFTVSLSNPSSSPVTVDFASADGSASGSDYTSVAGTLTFAAGETSKTVSVAVLGDVVSEPNETFTVVLSANAALPMNGTIGTGTATGTIVDNDGIGISINDVSQAEGNAGSPQMTFTVSLTRTSSSTITVAWRTVDGSARAQVDYGAASGTVSFSPGTSTQTIAVGLIPDLVRDLSGNETFTVELSSPVGATLGDPTGVGMIADDDPIPSISIVDAPAVPEGDSGAASAAFAVALTNPSESVVTVEYATSSLGAQQGVDFTATAGVLVFSPGDTTALLSVPVLGDLTAEPAETFQVGLSAPTNATVADGTALGTITDDDPTPVIAIDDVSITEGDAGTRTATFTVSLSNPTAQAVTVDATTTNGTATAGADYTGVATTTVAFAAGQTAASVTVSVLGDADAEGNETFFVDLSGASPGAVLPVGTRGTGTIHDDDTAGPPTLSVTDVSVGESGIATFTVALSAPSSQTIQVSYATVDGTAVAGADYTAISGTLTFVASDVSETVSVSIASDTVDEAAETFSVQLSGALNATIGDGIGVATIADDDATPSLAIADDTLPEGNSGVTMAELAVTLSNASQSTISVAWTTVDGTAGGASGDYASQSGTLTIAPGELSATISIAVNGDTAIENDEQFQVTLSDPIAATIADGSAAVTIVNDDTNAAPVAGNDVATTAEDQVLTIAAAALLDNDSDPNGSPLSVTAVSNPAGGTVSLAAGVITFTPAADFSGAGGFDYTVSDTALSDTGRVTVNVLAVNDAPVAADDAAGTSEDLNAVIGIASLLANDTDADGDALTLVDVFPGAFGSTSILAGTVVYSPDPNFNGADSFSYSVRDPSGALATATVAVTVSAVNDAPEVAGAAETAQEGVATTMAAVISESRDGSASGPWRIEFSWGDGSPDDVQSVNFLGEYSSTHVYADDGTYSAVVRVFDSVDPGTGADTPATLSATDTLSRTIGNNAPVIVSAVTSPGTVDENQLVTVLVNATDVAADPLTYSFDLDGDGSYETAGPVSTFDAVFDQSGDHTIGVRVSDDEGASVTAIVVAHVAELPPVLLSVTADPATVPEGTEVAISVSAQDDGGDPLTYRWDPDGDGLFAAGGTTINHTFPDEGQWSVQVEVADDAGLTVSGQGVVMVTNVAPAIAAFPAEGATEGVLLQVQASATEPGADALTWSLAGAPAGMAISPTGTISWVPAYQQAGRPPVGRTWNVTVSVDDGDGGSDSETLAIVAMWIDGDADGMADTWEISQGLDPNVNDAALDSDGDGISNLDEFNASSGGPFPPGQPVAVSPLTGSEANAQDPVLTLADAADPDGNASRWLFQVAADGDAPFAAPLVLASALATGTQSSVTIDDTTVANDPGNPFDADLADDTFYRWRAQGRDATGIEGAWSVPQRFFYNPDNDAPAAPGLNAPLDGSAVGVLAPKLVADNGVDVDDVGLVYEFEVFDDAGLAGAPVRSSGPVVEGANGSTSWIVSPPLADNTPYWWRVRVTDPHASSATSAAGSFLVDLAAQEPTTPVVSAPADGSIVTTAAPALAVANALDPEGAALTYFFEVDRSPTFSTADKQSSQAVAQGAGTTSWTPAAALLENATYWWRCRAFDGVSAGDWAMASFTVNATNEPPTAPVALGPAGGAIVDPASVELSAAPATDPEGDALTYVFRIYGDEAMALLLHESPAVTETAGGVKWEGPDLDAGTTFWWTATATDSGAAEGPASALSSFQTFQRSSGGGGGGCGCTTTPGAPSPLGSAAAVGALLALVARRRRRD